MRGPIPFAVMRVLVVDDEVDLADAVARGLRREGYAVDVAYGGVEAVEKVRLTPYDLICLDLTMPDMDGLTVCELIRADQLADTAPRILMLTARDSIDDRIVGLDQGADDYLVKPFSFGELAARIRSLLRRESSRGGALMTVGDIELDTARHRGSGPVGSSI